MTRKYNKLILLYAFVFLNLLIYLNPLPLKHEEPRRAIISQEMLFTHNFIVPMICQEPYYKKPPFHNWMIAITSLKDKYISNFDARLPSLISLILLSIFVFYLLKDLNIQHAFISSIISLTSFSTMISYGAKAEPDMLFTFLFFASYFFFVKDKVFTSSFFMGASILTKGISPLFFYPALLIYTYFEDEKIKFLKKLFIHFICSLILPFLWIILYYFYGNLPNLFHYLFFEVKDRTVSDIFDILKDALTFPFRAFLALFPWSLIFFLFYKKNKIKDKILLSSILIFSVIFLILFIFPCGKGRYFLPAVPFFAIIAGNYINLEKKVPLVLLKKMSIFSFLIFLCGGLFFIYKGYYFQFLFMLVLGIFMLICFRLVLNVKELGIIMSIFILLISVHFFNFYRAKYMYNYHKDAIFIISKLKKFGNYPIVVDRDYNKLRLLFNLEREYKMPLYRKKIFKKYFLLTTHPVKENKLLFIKKVKNKTLYFYFVNRNQS